MTEAEWQRCNVPKSMLQALLNSNPDLLGFDRLVRLFSAACCRMIWEDIPATSRRSVEAAEAFACGDLSVKQFRAAGEDWRAFNAWRWDWVYRLVATTMDSSISWRCESVDRLLSATTERPLADGNTEQQRYTLQHRIHETCGSLQCHLASKCAGPAPEGASSPSHPWHATFRAAAADANEVMCDLILCIVGNPFRAVVFDTEWRSSTVVELVRLIDSKRAYDRLPILADALEEAGCDDESVLAHCRADTPHAVGCWVVEWLARSTLPVLLRRN